MGMLSLDAIFFRYVSKELSIQALHRPFAFSIYDDILSPVADESLYDMTLT